MSRALKIAGGTAAVGAGALAVGMGTILGSLARAALRAELAVDDGPDELLDTPAQTPEQTWVRSADGTRLNVLSYGDIDDSDEVVVLVHGWTCSTMYWYPQINHLAGRGRVIAYDQRGHGASEPGRPRPNIALLGQDLDAVLSAVVPEGKRATLVGHSMGGMTIMSWSQQFPEKVDRLLAGVVLLSTADQAVMDNHLLIPVGLPSYTRPFVGLTGRAFTSAPLPIPRTAYGLRFAHYIALGRAARASHVAFVDEMIAKCPARVRAGWGAAIGRVDLLAGLEALSVPTTVVVGGDDRLLPPVHSKRMAEVLRRNDALRDLIILDGVGHMSSIEAGAEFNTILDGVIDDAEGRAVDGRAADGHRQADRSDDRAASTA
ncbi:alpha/beta fold hydrolase [Gordonia soli]|uniref:Putative hydrolase n=1 Tax=Gordonia soli NBRC 108243 TaxID=1223545 RepID=M0QP18_9ACTN|nr:alpha/beta hydrolase [Gordonia soli]GAC70154.1 putative hydrolase [Gordonia soli NBRC 108243]